MTQTYHVEGMTCDHCVMHVRGALTALEGVQSADVDLGNGTATVIADSVLDFSAVAAAIDEAGYRLVSSPQEA